MGGKSTKVRKMWLDIIYPPAPPPKHYISGYIPPNLSIKKQKRC